MMQMRRYELVDSTTRDKWLPGGRGMRAKSLAGTNNDPQTQLRPSSSFGLGGNARAQPILPQLSRCRSHALRSHHIGMPYHAATRRLAPGRPEDGSPKNSTDN